MEENLENYLPTYLKNDLDALVEGERTSSTLLDCLWCEVYGSINSAFVDRLITFEEAAYLRLKYLGLKAENPPTDELLSQDLSHYTLMHEDTMVADMAIDSATASIASISEIYNITHAPVGVATAQGNIDRGRLNDWWKRRGIPASRDGLRDTLHILGVYHATALAEKCFGLSLSDPYWVRPTGSGLTWTAANFFQNDFSENMGDRLFGRSSLHHTAMDLMSPDSTTNGWLKKKWNIIDGTRCLVKAGSAPLRQEAYNEVVATLLCQTMGIDHIPYRLTMVDGAPCSVCDNFVDAHTELVPAWAVMQTSRRPNHIPVYQHYLTCCKDLGVHGIQGMLDRMIVLDYLMMNEDRHQGNFGLLRNADTLAWIGAAPIFDTGSSLGFRFLTSRIKGDATIPCKPFKTSHEEQLKLVTDFSFVDMGALRNLRAPFLAIFQGSEFVEPPRAQAIYAAYLARVDALEHHMSQHHNT